MASKLEEQKIGFNFVGLSKGFENLLSKKEYQNGLLFYYDYILHSFNHSTNSFYWWTIPKLAL
ncbi:hypothetical protein HMPREF9952_0372 [Haemophilus pittmaniae HK 85]|uniref:Uncharacterized protein n=1 Tax=Haemophilus pittmaniae HK 85 TaxID=1035188 RepID=F9QA76_9PAST|nr:hypothetical protein HMPREF9952_0372 [Haemophilus pittmaniae HK 85]